jgi:hypothetical protein
MALISIKDVKQAINLMMIGLLPSSFLSSSRIVTM